MIRTLLVVVALGLDDSLTVDDWKLELVCCEVSKGFRKGFREAAAIVASDKGPQEAVDCDAASVTTMSHSS